MRVSVSREDGIALRAYEALVESRHQMNPDPLDPVSCDDLLRGVPRLTWPVADSRAAAG